MADVVGRIAPAVEITETPSWDAPSKCLFIEDAQSRLHGRIEWLADEVDAEFLRELAEFCAHAIREHQRPTRSRNPLRAFASPSGGVEQASAPSA